MKFSSKKARIKTRLSTDVKPIKYEIKFKPDIEAGIFQGEEKVYIEIDKDVKNLTMHAKDIDIENAFISHKGKNIPIKKISYDKKKETVSFFFDKVRAGKYTLHLSWNGILSDTMRGFYRSKFELEGKNHFIATTQFEATDARRAFPCFDEPSFKAFFDISLIIPGDLTAISNTLPKLIEEHESGYKVVHFESTPKMSTYLLAFIVGNFEYIEGKTKDGVCVRIYATPGKKHQAKFSLETGIKILEFFNDYFEIKYPLNTLDMIAVPDFESAAMENWGAVTYREAILLVDDVHSSISTKQLSAYVIAHELAHQWFGNLVTMEWWTHLWLNEGFAEYLGYVAVDHLFPEWKIWDQFVAGDLAQALTLDSLKSTHPIEVEVHEPSEISEIFDEISYQKGASVIRMLGEYLGAENFRKGLSHYLKKHSYKNTSTIHLWESFEKISKMPVKKIMDVWTKTEGYPYVSIENKNNSFVLKQNRFFKNVNNSDRRIWPIPFSIRYEQNDVTDKILFDKRKIEIDANDGWVKSNVGEVSVYRTLYSRDLISKLTRAIASKSIPESDRLGVLRDAFEFAERGDIEFDELLTLLESYKQETNYAVWSVMASGLLHIYSVFFGAPWMHDFEKTVISIIEPSIKKVGWKKKKNESHTDTLLRTLILGMGIYFGHKQTIKTALDMWKKVNLEKNNLDADLRAVVYRASAIYGNKRDFAKLRQLYKNNNMQEERNRLGRAMSETRDRDLLALHLQYAISEDVRAQDSIGLIVRSLLNGYGKELTWKFIKKEWKILYARYGEGGHFISRLIGSLGTFSNKKYIDEIDKFFKRNPAPSGERSLSQAKEQIEINSNWREREMKKIGKSLKKRP